MLSIAHVVTGAFIASQLPQQPWLYLPLALASHFILDFVTHYDVGIAAKIYHFSKKQIAFWAGLDLLGAIILVFLIWPQNTIFACRSFNCLQQTIPWPLWGAALLAILPDFMEATDYFFERPLPILKRFYRFHHDYHHSTRSAFWGLLPQVILVLAVWGMVHFS
jgi:hypothetical protein